MTKAKKVFLFIAALFMIAATVLSVTFTSTASAAEYNPDSDENNADFSINFSDQLNYYVNTGLNVNMPATHVIVRFSAYHYYDSKNVLEFEKIYSSMRELITDRTVDLGTLTSYTYSTTFTLYNSQVPNSQPAELQISLSNNTVYVSNGTSTTLSGFTCSLTITLITAYTTVRFNAAPFRFDDYSDGYKSYRFVSGDPVGTEFKPPEIVVNPLEFPAEYMQPKWVAAHNGTFTDFNASYVIPAELDSQDVLDVYVAFTVNDSFEFFYDFTNNMTTSYNNGYNAGYQAGFIEGADNSLGGAGAQVAAMSLFNTVFAILDTPIFGTWGIGDILLIIVVVAVIGLILKLSRG